MSGLTWDALSPALAARVRARLSATKTWEAFPKAMLKLQAAENAILALADRVGDEDTDVTVTGRMGLYSVRFWTVRSYKWMQDNIEGVKLWQAGALTVEGTSRCADIVAGLGRDGLKVTVNGVDMKTV